MASENAATFLPYGHQRVTEADIQEVVAVLRSDWLTQGPAVPAFEDSLARYLGAAHVVACSSGTAALHLAMLAAGLGPGDVVVTTPITFLATANCARFVGADVRFVDVDPSTALMDTNALNDTLQRDHRHAIKAVLPVHFAGQPADLASICEFARAHGAVVIDDACHALGAEYNHDGQSARIGGCPHADLTVFSFHPVKHITTAEGGAIATSHLELATRLRRLRSHGLQKEDFCELDMARAASGEVNPWYYEMQEVGFNYRLTDLQAALGTSQLKRLPWSLERRRRLAARYSEIIRNSFDDGAVVPLSALFDRSHAWHLFVVQIDFERYAIDRATTMRRLREAGIGTQVHYIPIHLQPYYRRHCGTGPGDFPAAEAYYARALSLPMYPDLSDDDCERVVFTLKDVLERGR